MAPDTLIAGAQPSEVIRESRVRNTAVNSAAEAGQTDTQIRVSRVSGHENVNRFTGVSRACPVVSQRCGHTRVTDVSGPLKGVRPDTRVGGPGKGVLSWVV